MGVCQMDASPAPVSDRLARASVLVESAAQQSAQIVVLPELFNIGYVYDDANYAAAETLDGQTVQWMKAQAARHNLYIAGSLLLLENGDIYNAALLIAPDGRQWRYDKNYPWLYERAYFRGRRNITIADTELGKLGILICWDAAHANLWQQYAGQVDAMLVISCPPNMGHHDLVFSDGSKINFQELNPGVDSQFPARDVELRAAWMQVPVAATTGSGGFKSRLPWQGLTARLELIGRPDLWRKADSAIMETGYFRETKIVDAQGTVLARIDHDQDGVVVAEVTYADQPPIPKTKQPPMHTHPFAYFAADILSNLFLSNVYRRGIKRVTSGR
jgi:predicted amidohydrolase